MTITRERVLLYALTLTIGSFIGAFSCWFMAIQ